MVVSTRATAERNESPDPASHASNVYDVEGADADWVDEEEDDDMDFEPTRESSEDVAFLESIEDDDEDFHGTHQKDLSEDV